MSEKQTKKTVDAKTGTAKKSFAYRNIKKEFTTFETADVISKQFHLELGENYEVKVVQDRDRDWQELANKDVDKVGLAAVLAAATKRGDPLDAFMFKDEEALDISRLDPDNPAAMESALSGSKESTAKLNGLAAKLGMTTDELISAFMDGSLANKIEAKVKPEEKEA